MLVFLDTEFTDFLDPMLISIGMVADSGEEFYAEVPYPDIACSAFVREVVIPLLNQYPNARCPTAEIGTRIRIWLETIRLSGQDIEICVDYQTDWDLFANALENRVPRWCRQRHIGRNINKLLRCEYHKKSGFPEHHALYDAKANHYAFRERPPVTIASITRNQ